VSDKLTDRLRIKSNVINMGEKIACNMGEKIAWGSDAALMDEAADRIDELEAKIDEARKLYVELTNRDTCEEDNGSVYYCANPSLMAKFDKLFNNYGCGL